MMIIINTFFNLLFYNDRKSGKIGNPENPKFENFPKPEIAKFHKTHTLSGHTLSGHTTAAEGGQTGGVRGGL